MRKKAANKGANKTLLAMILDSYQEYCSLGYPKDPSIYVISANVSTGRVLSEKFKNEAMTLVEVPENWGFQLKIDERLLPNEIVFGPEQIIIKWDGK